jgi:hypothetical protein
MKLPSLSGKGWVALPTLLLVLVLGCRGYAPAPPNPERAREVLHLALDTWQKGDTQESLKQQKPSVVAIDPDWSSGARLLAYKAEGDDQIGGELRCQVALSVKTKDGKTVQKKAVYNVATGPVLTVVREEEQ